MKTVESSPAVIIIRICRLEGHAECNVGKHTVYGFLNHVHLALFRILIIGIGKSPAPVILPVFPAGKESRAYPVPCIMPVVASGKAAGNRPHPVPVSETAAGLIGGKRRPERKFEQAFRRIPGVASGISPELFEVGKKGMLPRRHQQSGNLRGKFPFGPVLKRIAGPCRIHLGKKPESPALGYPEFVVWTYIVLGCVWKIVHCILQVFLNELIHLYRVCLLYLIGRQIRLCRRCNERDMSEPSHEFEIQEPPEETRLCHIDVAQRRILLRKIRRPALHHL